MEFFKISRDIPFMRHALALQRGVPGDLLGWRFFSCSAGACTSPSSSPAAP
jgi:hypothetical protein